MRALFEEYGTTMLEVLGALGGMSTFLLLFKSPIAHFIDYFISSF